MSLYLFSTVNMKILTPSARQLMTGQACLLQKWKRQTRLYVLTCVVDRSRQFVQLPAVSRTSLCNDKDYTRTFKYYLFMFQDSGLFQVTNKIPSSRAHNLRTYCIANKLTPRTTKYRPMPAWFVWAVRHASFVNIPSLLPKNRYAYHINHSLHNLHPTFTIRCQHVFNQINRRNI